MKGAVDAILSRNEQLPSPFTLSLQQGEGNIYR